MEYLTCQVAGEIFHGLPLESVAHLVYKSLVMGAGEGVDVFLMRLFFSRAPSFPFDYSGLYFHVNINSYFVLHYFILDQLLTVHIHCHSWRLSKTWKTTQLNRKISCSQIQELWGDWTLQTLVTHRTLTKRGVRWPVTLSTQMTRKRLYLETFFFSREEFEL